MRTKTSVRAGSSCSGGSTNCKGVDQATGFVFWDNCDHWTPFAGSQCMALGEHYKQPYCYKC